MPTATYGPTPTSAPPQLGYGQRAAAPIDAFNRWFRSRPEYYAKLQQFGQDPNDVHLNDYQKQEMVRLAQSLGAVIDEGHDGQEVDDSGNFRPKSHALRNTLIVAGIAAAALATAGAAGAFSGPALGAVEGGAYGVGADTVAAGAAGAGAAGAAAGAGAWDAAGNFIGPSTFSSYGPAAAKTGLSVTDALRYGLPTVGGVVSSLIQAHASGEASEAQQKYLEEALAYEKEQDAYKRTTEANRYATYSGNTAPYLATGQAANSRMASLLGLEVPAPKAVGSGQTPMAAAQSTAAPITTQPLPRTTDQPTIAPEPQAMITVQAPNGQTKQVPASERQHWESVGGRILEGVA